MRPTKRTWAMAGAAAAAVALAVLLVWWVGRSSAEPESGAVEQPQAPASAVASGAPVADPSSGPTAASEASVSIVPKPGEVRRPPGRGPAPAEQGETLEAITGPPRETVVLLGSGAALPGQRYEMTFRPYGYASEKSNLLVVRVLESELSTEGPREYDFDDMNLALAMSATSREKVKRGGTYDGLVEIRPAQGALQAVLLGARLTQ